MVATIRTETWGGELRAGPGKHHMEATAYRATIWSYPQPSHKRKAGGPRPPAGLPYKTPIPRVSTYLIPIPHGEEGSYTPRGQRPRRGKRTLRTPWRHT